MKLVKSVFKKKNPAWTKHTANWSSQLPLSPLPSQYSASSARIDFVLFSYADISLCNTTHWRRTEANKQPLKLIPIPKSDMWFSQSVPNETSHCAGCIITNQSCGLALCSVTLQIQRLPPPTLSCYFQRVWGLIWRCQESSFHCKHIKESERGSVFSQVHIIQMGKLASHSSTSRQLLRLTCRRGAGRQEMSFLCHSRQHLETAASLKRD